MTKLTKEQIEQEREKFEEWVSKNHIVDEYTLERVIWSDSVVYINEVTNITFSAWLARAELDKGELG